MIQVPQEVITEYLTDSVNKEIVIESLAGTLEDVNYYIGDIQGTEYSMDTVVNNSTASLSAWWLIPDTSDLTEARFDNYVEWSYLHDHEYIVCAFLLKT